MKTALITGITGQDGSYLSRLLLAKDYKVCGTILSPGYADTANLKYLNILDKVELHECDLLEKKGFGSLLERIRPDEVYHLAAQSSVGLSFERPVLTMELNTMPLLKILDFVKNQLSECRVFHPSSSEIFGSVKDLPIDENTPVSPLSPYAISKAASHFLVKTYRESFGIFACNGILFTHESYLRPSTFFVKKVIRNSIDIAKGLQDVLKVGNVDIKREIGYAPDYVEAMWLMLQYNRADDYVISSGSSVMLRDVIYYIFDKLGIDHSKLQIDESLYRPVDITDMYGNSSKARNVLNWKYDKSYSDVLDILLKEES